MKYINVYLSAINHLHYKQGVDLEILLNTVHIFGSYWCTSFPITNRRHRRYLLW